jgi:hypothetical protein
LSGFITNKFIALLIRLKTYVGTLLNMKIKAFEIKFTIAVSAVIGGLIIQLNMKSMILVKLKKFGMAR